MRITLYREIAAREVRPEPDEPLIVLSDDGQPLVVDEVTRRGDHVKIYGYPLHRVGEGRRVMVDRRGLDSAVRVGASAAEEEDWWRHVSSSGELPVPYWTAVVEFDGYDPDADEPEAEVEPLYEPEAGSSVLAEMVGDPAESIF